MIILNRDINIYIKKMDPFLAIKLSTSNDIKNFTVKNTTKYEINPNDKSVLKLSANYRWRSGSVSITPGVLNGNNNDILKGQTTTRTFKDGHSIPDHRPVHTVFLSYYSCIMPAHSG